MASEEDQENQGFTIKDQRRFNPDGSLKEEAVPAHEAREEIEEPHPLPPEEAMPADFVTLILSLASTAQMGLGVAPHPATGKPEKNLLQARHAIDLLGVLERKTKGNLSEEEAKLLEAVLGDLRMRYVEENKKG